MPRFVRDLTGHMFGRWIVVERADSKRRKEWWCACLCDASEPRRVGESELVNGDATSCGCWEREWRQRGKAAPPLRIKLCRDHSCVNQCNRSECFYHLARESTDKPLHVFAEPCSLRLGDVARCAGEVSQEEVAGILGVSPQALEQTEKRLWAKMRKLVSVRELREIFAERDDKSFVFPESLYDGDYEGASATSASRIKTTFKPENVDTCQTEMFERVPTFDAARRMIRAPLRELIRLTRRLDAIEARAAETFAEVAAQQPTEDATPCQKAS